MTGRARHGAVTGRRVVMMQIRTLLFLDQIKREKGVWWMPRQ
jgi:hypothetical protein